MEGEGEGGGGEDDELGVIHLPGEHPHLIRIPPLVATATVWPSTSRATVAVDPMAWGAAAPDPAISIKCYNGPSPLVMDQQLACDDGGEEVVARLG